VIHTGDCLDVMAGMDADSVDAIVTDPPYDLTASARGSTPGSVAASSDVFARVKSGGFMGKAWDGTGVAFQPATWAAALRVDRPGAYLLAFGGTRTVHRLTCALEDAGWVIRDTLCWVYASGFPKSRALLKPAWEPIVMARKPGPLRELDIDGCRIGTTKDVPASPNGDLSRKNLDQSAFNPNLGRWPANVILTDPVFDGGWDGVVGGGETTSGKMQPTVPTAKRAIYGQDAAAGFTTMETYGDTGTYSRFFLIPKASRSDREPLVAGGLEERLDGGVWGGAEDDLTAGKKRTRARVNGHPTVKPLELMRHLVRLVGFPGCTILDPFLGSGTTGLACEQEGFAWVGIEREPEYVAIAEQRLVDAQRGMAL